jgi:hypothetical protein
MKHPFSRELHAYWNACRGTREMPARGEVEPGALRPMLGDSFMLAGAEPRFRLAGTRLCALFGRELREQEFSSIWDAESAELVSEIVPIIAAEAVGIAAGAVAVAGGELRCNLEMLLLPLEHEGRRGARLIGVLAPLELPAWLGAAAARPLRLGAIRFVSEASEFRSSTRLAARRLIPRHGLFVIQGDAEASAERIRRTVSVERYLNGVRFLKHP